MTPKPAPEPVYDDALYYPAKDVTDVVGLSRDIQELIDTYTKALRTVQSSRNGYERQQEAAKLIVSGANHGQHLRRLLAEIAMNAGQTQREAAELVEVSRNTTYQWRHKPLSSLDMML